MAYPPEVAEREGSLANLVSLLVHDLRNPTATISANVSFVKDVWEGAEPDVLEALEDVEIALTDLNRGLENVALIGRWLASPTPPEGSGEVSQAFDVARQRIPQPVAFYPPEPPLKVAVPATQLGRLVEILIMNALSHAPKESVSVTARTEGDHVRIEVLDGGPAIHEDLRDAAFTMDGQHLIKGRTDGRYSRAAGLLAARALADCLGVSVSAGGSDGHATLWIDVVSG